MRRSISELKNTYPGMDIYILGSGASMNDFDKTFFENKTIIGLNNTYKEQKVDFCICTHRSVLSDGHDKTRVVCSDYDVSENSRTLNEVDCKEDYWVFKFGDYFDFSKNLAEVVADEDEQLCCGNSIIIAAMHFAAHLGARNIVLVGVDCCLVDGRMNYGGYDSCMTAQDNPHKVEAFRQHVNDFFIRNQYEISQLKAKLKAEYGCNVFTLTPYIGLQPFGKQLKSKLSVADVHKLLETKK